MSFEPEAEALAHKQGLAILKQQGNRLEVNTSDWMFLAADIQFNLQFPSRCFFLTNNIKLYLGTVRQISNLISYISPELHTFYGIIQIQVIQCKFSACDKWSLRQ